jgi:hypothetical protein
MAENVTSTSTARRAVLVLGMHRSGTSALAGVLDALGMQAPKTLSSAHVSNARGHWESAPLVALHDRLLQSAGSSWQDWRPLDLPGSAEPYRGEIAAAIAAEYGDAPEISIKDPRICRFVPWFASILDGMSIRPMAILPIRNPLEVAHSLQRRNGFTVAQSCLLWLRHVLDAEFHSRAMPRCFVAFKSLLGDWRAQMERARRVFGVDWPRQPPGPDAAVDNFLSMELYHERSSVEELQSHPEIARLVHGAYEALAALAGGGDGAEWLDRLDALRGRFDEACELFGRAANANEAALGRLLAEQASLAASHERLSQNLQGLAAERAALAAEREALAAERDALTRANDKLAAEREALMRANNKLAAERDALTQANATLAAERDAIMRANDKLAAERDALRQANSKLTADREAIAGQRDDAVRQLETILASRRWRMTAPLRRLLGRDD